jgi:Lamin Tail Domain
MRILLSIALGLALSAPVLGQAVISEFLADNASNLRDDDGEFSDWIELHNPTASEVSLTGWFLTDSPDNLKKWALPEWVLGPNEYRTVFASGKNRVVAGKPLHTNFGLAANGEYLALVQADGRTVASAWTPAYPEQFADVSYGSVAGTDYYFSKPTPGSANAPGFVAPVDAPRFSQSRGFFETPFALSLAVATPGAQIRYTD